MYPIGAGAGTVEKIFRKGEHKPIDGAEKNERKSQTNLKDYIKINQSTKSLGFNIIAQFNFILISHIYYLRKQAREFTEQLPAPLSASAFRRILKQLNSCTREMCAQTFRWMQFATLQCYKTPRDKGITFQQCFLTELLPGSTWCQIRLFVSHATCAQLADNCTCIRYFKEAPWMPTSVHIILCVQLSPPCSGVVCHGASSLLPITAFQCDKERHLWLVYTSLHARGIVTACSPLERDLLALDEETFFKAKADIFTEFIDKIPPLWAQIIVEHDLNASFKYPFSS